MATRNCRNGRHFLVFPADTTSSGECRECKNARNHVYEYTFKGRRSRFYRDLRGNARKNERKRYEWSI